MGISTEVWRVRSLKGSNRPDRIAIGTREFHGMDRPEYTANHILSSDEARYIGQELLKLAEAIDGKNKRDRTHAKVRKTVHEIAQAAKKEAMA